MSLSVNKHLDASQQIGLTSALAFRLSLRLTIQGVQHRTNLLIVTSVFFGAIVTSSSFSFSGGRSVQHRRRLGRELLVQVVIAALNRLDRFFRQRHILLCAVPILPTG